MQLRGAVPAHPELPPSLSSPTPVQLTCHRAGPLPGASALCSPHLPVAQPSKVFRSFWEELIRRGRPRISTVFAGWQKP